MRPSYLRRSFLTRFATCVASLGAIATAACHGDGRDPGANNRAATYVTPASNLPAPALAPATNTPAAGAPMTTPPANTNPAAQPRPSDSTQRDTTKAPNRTNNQPTNVAEPKRP